MARGVRNPHGLGSAAAPNNYCNERKGKERKGKERKGKERKGKERKGR
jgi:hypothetical protein